MKNEAIASSFIYIGKVIQIEQVEDMISLLIKIL